MLKTPNAHRPFVDGENGEENNEWDVINKLFHLLAALLLSPRLLPLIRDLVWRSTAILYDHAAADGSRSRILVDLKKSVCFCESMECNRIFFLFQPTIVPDENSQIQRSEAP